jgi:poly(3-hydroxybutyrate) depolymerase
MSHTRLFAVLSVFSIMLNACSVEEPSGADESLGMASPSAEGQVSNTIPMGTDAANGNATGTSGGQSGTSGTIDPAGSPMTPAVGGPGAGGSRGGMDRMDTAETASGGSAGPTVMEGSGMGGSGSGMETGGAGAGENGDVTGAAGSGASDMGGAPAIDDAADPGNTDGVIPLGNDPVPSAGCGTATTVTSGDHTITSGGQERRYIIDIPANYDMNKPYRFFYTSHWISARAEDVVGQNYYFLKPLAEAANEPAIFLAPQALPGNPTGTWDTRGPTDQVLFDDILAYVKENLCIDTTRVFATGFSFGGMMTYSLSVNHQKDIRAAVGIAPANYNIYVPPPTHEPIAWMQTTGMGDGTCPWVNGNSMTQGAKYIAIEHATDNGCTVPGDVPTWQSGGHLCYDFEGCPGEYPVKACTFDGPHTNVANDPGSNMNWIPQESWDFFMQF